MTSFSGRAEEKGTDEGRGNQPFICRVVRGEQKTTKKIRLVQYRVAWVCASLCGDSETCDPDPFCLVPRSSRLPGSPTCEGTAAFPCEVVDAAWCQALRQCGAE